MGIPIDPPIYGDDCLACFAAGETPEYMWLMFSDVLLGDDWQSGDPPAPHGPKLLQQGGNPCLWFLNDPPFYYQFVINVGPFHISSSFAGGAAQWFADTWPGGCLYKGDNQLNQPIAHHYYGGSAQVAFGPPGPSPSFTDVAALFGLTPDDELKFNYSHDSPYWTPQIISHKIPTNILVKKQN